MREERMRRIGRFVLGELFQEGAITVEQLDAALERQLELLANGRALTIGEVLVDMGFISKEQLARALERRNGRADQGAS